MTKKIKISKKLAEIIENEFKYSNDKIESFILCLPFDALHKELLKKNNFHVILLYLIGRELGVEFVEVSDD